MPLNTFDRGASLGRLKEPLANDLWKHMRSDIKTMDVQGNGTITQLYLNPLRTDMSEFSDRLDPIYDALDEPKYESAIQYKYYKRGHFMMLHTDVGYYDRITMITLGGDKTYLFEDKETREQHELNATHGDVLILRGDSLEMGHSFKKLKKQCGSIILRHGEYHNWK